MLHRQWPGLPDRAVDHGVVTRRPVLIFDSGIGGLGVLREIRRRVPSRRLHYVADDAGFPYGDWDEDRLTARLMDLFTGLLTVHEPALVVLACNTATTLALEMLRGRHPEVTFVGIIPAIKPAAEHSRSRRVSVLATPATIRRTYTHELVNTFAADCRVRLVPSAHLAGLAEAHARGWHVADADIGVEIAPCFIEEGGRRTDVVVLGCTHYPLLIDAFTRLAPWPVAWLNPAAAVARRVQALLGDESAWGGRSVPSADGGRVWFTSGASDGETRALLRRHGLRAG